MVAEAHVAEARVSEACLSYLSNQVQSSVQGEGEGAKSHTNNNTKDAL